VTTQEAREQALQEHILTEAGFAQGYVGLKPGRWLWRFWLELERFNDALQRVEANTFTLLGQRQVDFTLHIQAFQAALADYRATTRRLTYHANTLASGRVKDLEHLTQQALGAWRDDPSPPPFADPPGAAAPPAAAPVADVPRPAPDLTTWYGPSLAEERAAAQREEGG
jgi:hypothetical protein